MTTRFRSVAEALAWLDRFQNLEAGAGPAGVIAAGRTEGLSLEPMAALLALLGDPQLEVPAIHITGTNGKGSVAAMATRLIAANGLSVGTYTSPHQDQVTERIRRNGDPITEVEFCELLEGLAAFETLFPHRPSWFELMTAAAFRYFAEAPVDAAVIEVGLLGRFDATNLVPSRVSVCTSIGKDHTDGAPGWEARVASEKAGIVTPGSVCVLGPMPDELAACFEAEGPERLLRFGTDVLVTDDRAALGGRLVGVRTPWTDHESVHLPVYGAHQTANLAVAIAAVEAFFDRALDDEVIVEAIGGLALPGRVEVVRHEPLVVLDGAHNPDSARALTETLDESFVTAGSRLLVVGMLEGRDPQEFLEALDASRFDLVVCTTPPGARGLDAEVLASAAARIGVSARVVPDPATAVEAVVRRADEQDLVVVAGSFHLLAQARLAVRRAASA